MTYQNRRAETGFIPYQFWILAAIGKTKNNESPRSRKDPRIISWEEGRIHGRGTRRFCSGTPCHLSARVSTAFLLQCTFVHDATSVSAPCGSASSDTLQARWLKNDFKKRLIGFLQWRLNRFQTLECTSRQISAICEWFSTQPVFRLQNRAYPRVSLTSEKRNWKNEDAQKEKPVEPFRCRAQAGQNLNNSIGSRIPNDVCVFDAVN